MYIVSEIQFMSSVLQASDLLCDVDRANTWLGSQVHDIHPSHAFLVVAEKPIRSRSEPEYSHALPMIMSNDNNEERCECFRQQFPVIFHPMFVAMKHPGVKCAQ
jgi:hypothetical protein